MMDINEYKQNDILVCLFVFLPIVMTQRNVSLFSRTT